MAYIDNLTIMFVDMVGFTERTARQSRAQNRAMLRRFNRLLTPLVSRFRGKLVKSIGDSLLVSFRSPTDAVHCGMAMHDRCAVANKTLDTESKVKIRVALNLGEVRVERNDLFGEAVNIAARIESETPGDEIYFSEAVHLSMNKAEVPSEPLGERELRGIPEPIRLYRVPPRTVNRLVPAGEPTTNEDELPYGGSHLNQRDLGDPPQWHTWVPDLDSVYSAAQSWITYTPQLRLIALCAVLALLVAVWMVQRGEPMNVLLDEAREDIAESPLGEGGDSGDATGSSANAEGTTSDSGPTPAERRKARKLLATGHEQYAKRLRGDALGLYERALSLDSSLKTDETLVVNLIESLGRITRLSEPLILEYISPPLLDSVARRSGEAGPYGRAAAIRILRKLNRPDRIDRVGAAIVTLKEADTCENKLGAIKQIRQLGDPSALPLVRQQIDGGFAEWMKNRCLWDYAKETVDELAQSQNNPS